MQNKMLNLVLIVVYFLTTFLVSFVQIQDSSRNVYIYILKCSKWPQTPLVYLDLCSRKPLYLRWKRWQFSLPPQSNSWWRLVLVSQTRKKRKSRNWHHKLGRKKVKNCLRLNQVLHLYHLKKPWSFLWIADQKLYINILLLI